MSLPESYIQWVKKCRKEKKLHGVVEDKLVEVLSFLSPAFEPIKEPQGLAGGRNDLMLFRFDGKKVLFEIFGTKSQVSRDLRILDKTSADKKIAIIVDKEVDAGVIDKFLKENPESNYPYLFVSELFIDALLTQSKRKLRYLILGDEDSWFQFLLHQKLYVNSQEFKEFVDSMKELGFSGFSKEELDTGKISVGRVFNMIILRKLKSIGLKREKLLFILSWLSKENSLSYLLKMLDHGLNVFLYIDFEGGIGFYSDVELTDYLRIGYALPEPQMILSMNSVIHEIIEKGFITKLEIVNKDNCIQYTVGFSEVVKSQGGKVVTFGVPLGTNRIIVKLPCSAENHSMKPVFDAESCKEMMEFVSGDTSIVFQLHEFEQGYSHFFKKVEKHQIDSDCSDFNNISPSASQ